MDTKCKNVDENISQIEFIERNKNQNKMSICGSGIHDESGMCFHLFPPFIWMQHICSFGVIDWIGVCDNRFISSGLSQSC